MTSQTGQQTIVIHIFPNVFKSKGNHTMEFGQLIKYNIRYIFLEKSCTKCDGETSSRRFSGKLKFSISLDQQSKVLYSLLLLNLKLRTIKIYRK